MGKASNGKTKSVKPKSDHAARKYETRVVGIDAVALERLQLLGLEPRRVTETEKRNGKQKRA